MPKDAKRISFRWLSARRLPPAGCQNLAGRSSHLNFGEVTLGYTACTWYRVVRGGEVGSSGRRRKCSDTNFGVRLKAFGPGQAASVKNLEKSSKNTRGGCNQRLQGSPEISMSRYMGVGLCCLTHRKNVCLRLQMREFVLGGLPRSPHGGVKFINRRGQGMDSLAAAASRMRMIPSPGFARPCQRTNRNQLGRRTS